MKKKFEYDLKKMIEEANKKGQYLPNQIMDQVEASWAKFNPDGAETVDKATAKQIVEECINSLGQLGSEKKYDEKEFDAMDPSAAIPDVPDVPEVEVPGALGGAMGALGVEAPEVPEVPDVPEIPILKPMLLVMVGKMINTGGFPDPKDFEYDPMAPPKI